MKLTKSVAAACGGGIRRWLHRPHNTAACSTTTTSRPTQRSIGRRRRDISGTRFAHRDRQRAAASFGEPGGTPLLQPADDPGDVEHSTDNTRNQHQNASRHPERVAGMQRPLPLNEDVATAPAKRITNMQDLARVLVDDDLAAADEAPSARNQLGPPCRAVGDCRASRWSVAAVRRQTIVRREIAGGRPPRPGRSKSWSHAPAVSRRCPAGASPGRTIRPASETVVPD
jgi:hypothetical protein